MAFLDKDWFVRQLQLCVDMAASLILGKDFSPYEPIGSDPADALHLQILSLLDENDVNSAEDLLFDTIDGEDPDLFHVGLDFYYRLNQMDDPQLSQLDFSREEIREGLTDMAEEYGCSGLFDQLRLSWTEE